MEALQILKFQLKKDRLNFTQGWATTEEEMLDDRPEQDLLRQLIEVGDNFQDVLDLAIQSIDEDLN
jgi:hypothetical protein